MLRVDPHNPRATGLAEELRRRLDLAALPDDLHVVIGGDGWMLQCIREGGDAPTYLGLNAGSLGFLLNDVDDLDRVAAALRAGDWSTHAFPRLALSAVSPDGRRASALAVNDLYVERSSGQSAHLRLHIDGEPVIDKLVCDGLIVSTALGSTAYSFAAGGVPCHPLVRAMHVTPISPHVPRLSPFTVPADARIAVEALAVAKRPVRAVADGEEHGPVARVEVARAPREVRLAFLEGHAFTRTFIRKILR